MKSIADGGVCHQFHYAGVVTKIISMIDEMATRPHAEIMPDARESGTLRGALRKRVKLTCNFFFPSLLGTSKLFLELHKLAGKFSLTVPQGYGITQLYAIIISRACAYSGASLSSGKSRSN